MLELYHNAASTCSQKVRLVLAEKQLDYESHQVDLIGGGQHDPEYIKLNPGHVVPTLVHDGQVLIESSLINEYLDDAFPDLPLRPVGAAGRHAMRLWTKRIDDVHPNAGIITYGIGTRPLVLQRSAEDIEATWKHIPDRTRREQRRSVVEQGVDAPVFGDAMRAFVRLLEQLQSDLAQQPFVAGEAYTLADAAVTPYVMRLDHLAMTPLVERYPSVEAWYARVQARPSYEHAISAQLPQFVIDMFSKNGAAVWDQVEAQIEAL